MLVYLVDKGGIFMLEKLIENKYKFQELLEKDDSFIENLTSNPC